ncbi:glycosyltransferase family 2 protein [Salibacterium halotolerans]|uniref:Glucosyl-3-phosphoglycerate synthase n=1 Tax=Salibacterium halotolerans TaxID=1884432 RepID=A0A1I5NQ53_9BACI|nr:glycosyltransferase family 2 protein [Salibacterium halotolerans]SFP23958.1 Glycosyltransferase involved in cell wall bisynthesis [Salibacterium halotolerans]
MNVSVIIPAFNEEQHVRKTIHAVRNGGWAGEIIGVNDGSSDRTGRILEYTCDTAVSFIKNQGKTAAAKAGWMAAGGDVIVTLDADLGESAVHGALLLDPLYQGTADLVIGTARSKKREGMGFLKKRVQHAMRERCGLSLDMPLSGQRAFFREHLDLFHHVQAERFALETMMNLHAHETGLLIQEVEAPFLHQGKGAGLTGFIHRGRQWLEVERCLRKYGRSSSAPR